jgi:hypothetical protein
MLEVEVEVQRLLIVNLGTVLGKMVVDQLLL